MKDMCLDLTKKLDANGLLESSVVAVIQEHNKRGHESWNVPVITFGAAGGLKTGQYLDYRNFQFSRDDRVYSRLGYPINQLHANLLRACGVPTAEFEALNKQPDPLFAFKTGYGVSRFQPIQGVGERIKQENYTTWSGANLSDWLPGIKA